MKRISLSAEIFEKLIIMSNGENTKSNYFLSLKYISEVVSMDGPFPRSCHK